MQSDSSTESGFEPVGAALLFLCIYLLVKLNYKLKLSVKFHLTLSCTIMQASANQRKASVKRW